MRPIIAALLVTSCALGAPVACIPPDPQIVWIRGGGPDDRVVRVADEATYDDGFGRPFHAMHLTVDPVRETTLGFSLDEESWVTAGTLTRDADGKIGLDPNEDVVLELLPAGDYDLRVSAPGGADILLGAKPMPTDDGEVGMRRGAVVPAWIYRTLMKLIPKRIAQHGLSGVCDFTRDYYQSQGQSCPMEFTLPPLCIVGYGMTCAHSAQ
ncbi:MAG: hypothetical protein IT385_22945 [Deltaproteobacteria bacterium]|nr:hypothetical protein [Deltaproteobacteria bacterium]